MTLHYAGERMSRNDLLTPDAGLKTDSPFRTLSLKEPANSGFRWMVFRAVKRKGVRV